MEVEMLTRLALLRRPQVGVLLRNIIVTAQGDGILRLELGREGMFAAVWEALGMHGLGQEVELLMLDRSYYYQAQLGADERVYLHPADSNKGELPDANLFVKQAVNLLLPWA